MRGIGKDLQAAFNLGYKARDAEIVRCRECKHCWTARPNKVCVCSKHGYKTTGKEWFCADGERKEQDDE